MPMFILNDATGIGSNDLDSAQAFVDLAIIADDGGVGVDDPVGGTQNVTYGRTQAGPPQLRLDDLVNTTFTPDYGSGPQQVDVIIIAGLSGFVLDDGTSFENNGTALPPASSGLAGAGLNTTENCLVIYDTQQNICVARDGTGGDIDLSISNPVVLYHEFSHAFRVVTNAQLALTAECDPASPEENAAIVDENDLRTQIANRQGNTPELRDPDIHCGQVGCDSGCCIIATVASRSLSSPQVQFLRSVRDYFVRSTEVGFAFFERFFRDYYSFSPQVCTLMARHPGMSDALLMGYIEPLLDFWKIMIERAQSRVTDRELGAAFVSLLEPQASPHARMAALRQTAQYWQSPSIAGGRVPDELIALLKDRAWPSEYIQWALVAPVRIYSDLLAAHLDGADAETLGHAFAHAVDAWSAEMPISDVWAALSRGQVLRELRFCHRALLRSERSRRAFHRRLRERFSEITSVHDTVDRLAGVAGETLWQPRM
jgi:hypothetical protein